MPTFAMLALALSALGAYGVMSYAVSYRTAEIGVRMALGAAPSPGLRTAIAGTAVGMLSAIGAARALENTSMTSRKSTRSSICRSWLSQSRVAILASYVPARRAMRLDHLFALRQD